MGCGNAQNNDKVARPQGLKHSLSKSEKLDLHSTGKSTVEPPNEATATLKDDLKSDPVESKEATLAPLER